MFQSNIMKYSCSQLKDDFAYQPIGRKQRHARFPNFPCFMLIGLLIIVSFYIMNEKKLSLSNMSDSIVPSFSVPTVSFPDVYSFQEPSIEYNNADSHAKYGMTPIKFQDIADSLPKPGRLSADAWATREYPQIWYDPENISHRKTTRKLRELGVTREEALEMGWDWTAAIRPNVRDQARTGTCWQFSATLVAEYAWWIAGNEMTKLAPQVLGDCVDVKCVGPEELCTADRSAPVNVSVSDQVQACMFGDCHFETFDNYEFCDPEDDAFPARGCEYRNGWGGGSQVDAWRYYHHAGFVKENDYPFRHCAGHDWEYRHRHLTLRQQKDACLAQHRYCYWDREQVYPFSKCMLGLPSSLPCKWNKADKVVGRTSGTFLVSRDNDDTYHQGSAPAILLSEERMKQALVDVGPLSISIVSGPMHYYQSGIMDLPADICEQENGDHAVTIVGFGTENGIDYWKIQNSWGNLYGEDGGFVRIRRGKNICAVASQVSTTWI